MFSLFGFVNIERSDEESLILSMFEKLAARGGAARAIHADPAAHVRMGARGGAEHVKHAVAATPSNSLIAVIEGEIYNGAELRQLAGLPPAAPNEHPAFPAILPMYEKFGKDFPKYLNGIFAIALWDRAQNTLHLIRDHLGARSLFYAPVKQGVMFASALPPLVHVGVIAPRISYDGLRIYLAANAITPPLTMFEQVFCVRPGHVVSLREGKAVEHDYWGLKSLQEDRVKTENEFAEELRALIVNAIEIRARYGGEYGCLLSGGIDSSLIAATLCRYHDGKPFPALSIAFDEQEYSDADLQKIMYQRYPLQPAQAILRVDEFAAILEKGAAHLDNPVNDHAYVGMFKAFELARQTGCAIAFDGIGADQLFCSTTSHGEREFQKFLIVPHWIRQHVLRPLLPSIPLGDALPTKVLRLLYRIGLSDAERNLTWVPSFYGHATPILNETAGVLDDPLRIGKAYLAETALRDPMNIYHYGLMKTFLADDLVFKNERMASANQVMNRMPFLDFRLAEAALRTPQRFKIRQPAATDDGSRLLYKQAIHGMLPDEILYRKKARGFSHPTSVWFRTTLKDFLRDTVLSPNAHILTYLNASYVRHIVTQHLEGAANFDYHLNSLLILECWLKAFLRP